MSESNSYRKHENVRIALTIACIFIIVGATVSMIVDTERNIAQSQESHTADLWSKTLALFYVSPYESTHNFSQSGFSFAYVEGENGSGTLTYYSTVHMSNETGKPLVLTIWGYKTTGTGIGYNPPRYVNDKVYTVYSVNVQFGQAFAPIKCFHVGDTLTLTFQFMDSTQQISNVVEAYEPVLLIFTEAPSQTACPCGN